ncbi:MAG: AraC family transcriptional regulator, partial [Pseudomonadota bacterium]
VAHVLDQTGKKAKPRLNGFAKRDLMALERVREAIHAAPYRDFTLQQLASDAGMSLSSLKAKFPKAFGQTVFAYLRGVRLDYARDRIVHDGWTVSEAAHFVGYRHVGNFSKAFRIRFGVTPLEVRRRQRP